MSGPVEEIVKLVLEVMSYLLVLCLFMFLAGGLILGLIEGMPLLKAYYVHVFIFVGNGPPDVVRTLVGRSFAVIDALAGQLLVPSLIGVLLARVERKLEEEKSLETRFKSLGRDLGFSNDQVERFTKRCMEIINEEAKKCPNSEDPTLV